MADKESGGGKKSGLLGSVWIKLGLKLDDLKGQLKEAKKEVQDAFETDPVKELKEETKKVEQATAELKEQLQETKNEIKEAFDTNAVKELKAETKAAEQIASDLTEQLQAAKTETSDAFDATSVENFSEEIKDAEKNTDKVERGLKDTEEGAKEAFDTAPVEDFNEETKKTDEITSDLSDNLGKMLKTILAVFAVKNVADFFSECEDLIQTQQMAEQKLESAMVNRFNATKQEIQEIKDLASGLQDLGTIGDEVALSGAAKLSSYVESVDTLKTLLPSIQDIAVSKLGTEVDQEQFADMAKTVGEAFVEGSLSPLKSLDIAISEETEASWKALTTEEERAAYFVDLINDKVGKVNGSLSDTLSVETKLNNTIGDIKENVGSFYQLFIVPIRSMVLSIAQSVNGTLTSLANILGVQMVRAENATNKAASSTANYFKNATKEAEKTKRALLGIDEIQQLGLTEEEDDSNDSLLTSLNNDDGVITQTVQFDYEEGSFADRITEALSKIGRGIATYIGDKIGIAFDADTIENFVVKLEELGNWIEEHPEEFANLIDGALTFIKVLGGLWIITSVIGWLGNLANSVTGIASLFGTLGPILTNPWTLVIGVLMGVAAVFWMVRDSIAESFETLIDFISDPMRYVSYLVDIGDYVFSWFLDLLGSLLSSLWDWMKGVGQSISDWWNGLWNGKDGAEIQAQVDTSWTTTAAGKPHFATGGFLKANTPTLAVVGDNTRQGEFVLTEEQFAHAANKYGNGGDNSELIAVAKAILEAILGLELTTKFDLDALAEYVITYAQKKQRATGRSVI